MSRGPPSSPCMFESCKIQTVLRENDNWLTNITWWNSFLLQNNVSILGRKVTLNMTHPALVRAGVSVIVHSALGLTSLSPKHFANTSWLVSCAACLVVDTCQKWFPFWSYWNARKIIYAPGVVLCSLSTPSSRTLCSTFEKQNHWTGYFWRL